MYVELKLFLSRTLLILRDILLKIISVVKPKEFAENVFVGLVGNEMLYH